MDEECPICLDTIKAKFVTDCKHEFCAVCIIEWSKVKRTCPKCRARLTDEESEDECTSEVDEDEDDDDDENIDMYSETAPEGSEEHTQLKEFLTNFFGTADFILCGPMSLQHVDQQEIILSLNHQTNWMPPSWVAHYESIGRQDIIRLLNSGVVGDLDLVGLTPPEELHMCNSCEFVATDIMDLGLHNRYYHSDGNVYVDIDIDDFF